MVDDFVLNGLMASSAQLREQVQTGPVAPPTFAL